MLYTGTASIRICQEGHANALAMNKECSQIAVAGRSLLKVFSIEHEGFTEVCNMRGGKNQNLSYSSNDVAWSSLDNNILATAATNGVVSVWDLSKFGRQKQLLVYNEHERTAHTVTFHSTEPNFLLSGSQDGTIKCFDIRYEKSVYTYFSNSESVRDLKFSPGSPNTFAAVSENGTVQVWDMRKPDKCTLQFTAHSGPVYTCDWHPTNNWLATGSRDKQIKVWNMESKAALEHTIHTIAVVGRVKWRPEKVHHIASCALVVDYSIHIWDIRRPYIPFATFNEHTNVTTGIAWKGNNPDILLSTSKDSTIYKHAFKDATNPALRANPQGASLNPKGDFLYAIKVKETPPQSQTSKTTSFMNRQKPGPIGDRFHIAQSILQKFVLKPSHTGYIANEKTSELKEHECFVGCAKEYILSGKKLSEMCEHNATVTMKYGKHNATTLWNFVKLLYGSIEFNTRQSEPRGSFSTHKNLATKNSNILENDSTQSTIHLHSQETICPKELNDFPVTQSVDQHSGLEPVISTEPLEISGTINFKSLRDGFLYVGPHDATKPLSLPDAALNHDFHATRRQSDLKAEKREESSTPPETPTVIKLTNTPKVPIWQPHQVITDCLLLQIDMGDVQTTLCILIAMGEFRKSLPIADELIEYWFHSYIDLLHRYQLWNEATTIINLSWIRSVQQLNQQSTTVHTSCADCGRSMSGSVGWYCEKCKAMQSSKCCVCGQVVRGLYAWCQGCSHGGHLEHLKEYFSNRSKCPKCGHLCEYD